MNSNNGLLTADYNMKKQDNCDESNISAEDLSEMNEDDSEQISSSLSRSFLSSKSLKKSVTTNKKVLNSYKSTELPNVAPIKKRLSDMVEIQSLKSNIFPSKSASKKELITIQSKEKAESNDSETEFLKFLRPKNQSGPIAYSRKRNSGEFQFEANAELTDN